MPNTLIYSALRTPIGRMGGGLADVRADDLAAMAIKAAVERSGADPSKIDDVVFGCSNQSGEDNRNVARMGALLAGLPVEIPGQTVNRLCGSGLQAVASCHQAIQAQEGSLFVAGGVENMTRAPFVSLKTGKAWDRQVPPMADTTVGWRFTNPKLRDEWTVPLGITAENVAEKYGISREEQESFALESQAKTAKAFEQNVFETEIITVDVPQRKGDPITVAQDEHPRTDITRDQLAKLRPAFRKDGSVTAGTSSGINDGSSALILATADAGVPGRPMARVVGSAVAGVDPALMGMGPVPATKKLLDRLGMTLDQIDLIELNEAFAAQSLGCIRELGLDPAKVNVHGGAIALGHPLGCSGARILVTLIHALHRHKARYGLATMCIGVGQGIAMVVERVE